MTNIEHVARAILGMEYKVGMEMDKLQSVGMDYDFLNEISEDLSYKAFELYGVPITEHALLYGRLAQYHQRNYHKSVDSYVDGVIKIIMRSIHRKAK